MDVGFLLVVAVVTAGPVHVGLHLHRYRYAAQTGSRCVMVLMVMVVAVAVVQVVGSTYQVKRRAMCRAVRDFQHSLRRGMYRNE